MIAYVSTVRVFVAEVSDIVPPLLDGLSKVVCRSIPSFVVVSVFPAHANDNLILTI